jgi:electron transfer flavoprotein alpha subunit
MKMAAKVDSATCAGCGVCVPACPVEAIEIVDGQAKIDDSKCIECGACVGECPCGAISM